MKFTAALALASMVAGATAHSTVYSYFLNGVDKGQQCTLNSQGKQQGGPSNSVGNYRCPLNNNPVKDLTGSSMICNVNNAEAPKWDAVYPGDSITFEWHHDSPYASDDIIASSHKGAIAIYVAPAASNGVGAVWVKLWQDGVKPNDWAVDRLIQAKGRHWFKVPNLKPGKYLFRPELFTLHEADTAYSSNPARGIQLYPACLQFEVLGSGDLTVPSGVTFPGAYSYSDPGIVYNLYNPPAGNYVIPGPSVWSAAGVTAGYGIGPANTSQPPVTTTAVRTTTTTTSTGPTNGCNPVTVTETVQGAAQTVTVTVQGQTTTQSGNTGTAALYGQCGGRGWTGPTRCASGSCKASGEYYSQCLP